MSSKVFHDEHHGQGHHHVHHDEAHESPHLRSYTHTQSSYHEPQPMQMHIMDPHKESNQLFVRFPLKVVANPSVLNGDPKQQKEKLNIDVFKAIEAAADDQSLVVYDSAGGCYKSMDLKCMSGFVSKICIENYKNTFPFDLALDFPGTECAYKRNPDGTKAGTFVIYADTPFCCAEKCVFEVRHRDSIKKQITKYGGYKSPDELWHGCHDYGGTIEVPANCMGAHVVLGNLYHPTERPGGFKVSTAIVKEHTHLHHGYYAWPREVIDKVNAQFRADVLPAIAGKLLNFECESNYIIKVHRPDEKLDGQDERDFVSREGTVFEGGNEVEARTAFNTNHIMIAEVRLVLGLTSKAAICPSGRPLSSMIATGCCA